MSPRGLSMFMLDRSQRLCRQELWGEWGSGRERKVASVRAPQKFDTETDTMQSTSFSTSTTSFGSSTGTITRTTTTTSFGSSTGTITRTPVATATATAHRNLSLSLSLQAPKPYYEPWCNGCS